MGAREQEWVDCYFNRILPIYRQMASDARVRTVHGRTPIQPFFTQWGREYPMKRDKGILFVGRATNGWDCKLDPMEWDSMGETSWRFNSPRQMEWISEKWNCSPGGGWHGAKSPYWRLIRSIAESIYPDAWHRHVAWSNVCKWAPDGGNPSAAIYEATLAANCELLKIDIEMLSPRTIIMITGSEVAYDHWSAPFVRTLAGDVAPVQTIPLACKRGGSIKIFATPKLKLIVCDRPEFRGSKLISKNIRPVLLGA